LFFSAAVWRAASRRYWAAIIPHLATPRARAEIATTAMTPLILRILIFIIRLTLIGVTQLIAFVR